MRIVTMATLVAAGVLAGSIGVPAASAQSACADLGGVVGNDQICRVHAADSPIGLWVVPTDEERVIAQHTAALVRMRGA